MNIKGAKVSDNDETVVNTLKDIIEILKSKRDDLDRKMLTEFQDFQALEQRPYHEQIKKNMNEVNNLLNESIPPKPEQVKEILILIKNQLHKL